VSDNDECHFAGTTAEWHYGKQRVKRCVLRRLRKTARGGAGVTWCGKPFQTRAAATGKARSPIVDSRVRWTDSNDDEADRRRRRASQSAGWRSSSARSQGACSVLTLATRRASLKSIRSAAINQWSWWRSGATGSYLDEPKTSRAAEFITDWSRLRRYRDASDGWVSVIQSRQDERRHQWLENRSRNGPTNTT